MKKINGLKQNNIIASLIKDEIKKLKVSTTTPIEKTDKSSTNFILIEE